ncbi:unnamed protein product, partial [Staurois parvus]
STGEQRASSRLARLRHRVTRYQVIWLASGHRVIWQGSGHRGTRYEQRALSQLHDSGHWAQVPGSNSGSTAGIESTGPNRDRRAGSVHHC